MSEWIPRITAETATAEIIQNPSALNPYPERVVDGTFGVGENYRMPTFSSNFHVYVKYDDDNITRGQMPVRREVLPADMQPPTEPDEAYEKRWQPPESVDSAEFKPVAEYFDKEAPYLARSWLCAREREAIKGLKAKLFEQYQQEGDRGYVRFILESHTELINAGKPGAALIMANMLGKDRLFVDGEWQHIYGADTLKNIVIPRMLEPGFRKSPEELMPSGSDEAHLDLYGLSEDIGRQALSLFELSLEQSAVVAARSLVEHVEVSRKVALLEADVEKQSLRLTNVLHRIAEKIPDFVRTDDGIDLTTASAKLLSDHLLTKLLAATDRG